MSTPLLSEPTDALTQLQSLPHDAAPNVDIYTDGACSGNPGPGGWGAVVRYQSLETDMSGGEVNSTNNRMEMMAAVQSLKALPLRCKVTIHTDSMYLRDGVTRWMINWKKNGWLTADRKPVKNQDIWQELDKLLGQQDITWKWVKGHAGHPENERADALARNGVVSARMRMG